MRFFVFVLCVFFCAVCLFFVFVLCGLSGFLVFFFFFSVDREKILYGKYTIHILVI